MASELYDTAENILPFQGEAFLFPCFFSATESQAYLGALAKEIDWKQEPVTIFGRQVMQPRLTAWVGDPDKTYRYSGITMIPQKWTPALLEIKERIESIAGVRFTNALLNYYRDGQDSMGWHRDNEKELGTNPVIGSVSLGAPRIFQLRNYHDKKTRRSFELGSGSFLLMKGETQHHWEHQLPKTTRSTGIRINLTFRIILGPPALSG